jgi:hypothetical protein
MAAEGEAAVGRMVAEAAAVVRTEAAEADTLAADPAAVGRTPLLTGVLPGRRLTTAGIGGIRSMAAARRRKRAALGPERTRQTRMPAPASQRGTIPGKIRQ